MNTRMEWFKTLKRPCPSCHGEGVFPSGCKTSSLLTCPTCTSKGIVSDCSCVVRNEEMLCDNPNCNKGKVKRTVIQADGNHLTVLEDCPVCDGLNRIVKQVEESWEQPTVCPSCKGVGTISCEELEKKNLQVLCDTCHGIGYLFDKKKVAMLGGVAGLIFLMPMVAFGGIMFVAMVFSMKTVLTKKNSEPKKIRKSKRGKLRELETRI